ncbi:hypothetical protein C8J56DRAFT_899784 [Mycena floridula]|nr:hypothetical protein C8J56DRAFT_899784 [Mycena floridula]
MDLERRRKPRLFLLFQTSAFRVDLLPSPSCLYKGQAGEYGCGLAWLGFGSGHGFATGHVIFTVYQFPTFADVLEFDSSNFSWLWVRFKQSLVWYHHYQAMAWATACGLRKLKPGHRPAKAGHGGLAWLRLFGLALAGLWPEAGAGKTLKFSSADATIWTRMRYSPWDPSVTELWRGGW